MPQGIGPLISIGVGIRGMPDANAVENDEEGAGSCFHGRDELVTG